MIRKLQHVFALSEKGARDFVKAVAWCFLCNVSLMLPVGVVMATLQYLLETLETGADPAAKVLVYTGGAAAVLALLRIGGVAWPEVWQNGAFYALGALAGAAASALVRVRKNPLELLQVKE